MKSDYITIYGMWSAVALLIAFCYPRLEVVWAVIGFILVYGLVMIFSYLANRGK